MNSKKGYIPISRGLFENELIWETEEPFDKRSAWIDLIQMARYDKATKRLIKGRYIEEKRGEKIASIRLLMKRWKWGNTKVSNFLKLLESEGMIKRHTRQQTGVITICKYDSYNKTNGIDKTATRQRQDSDKTVTRQRQDNINKGNKGNKVNKGNKGENQNFPSNPDLNNQISDLEKKIGGIHFKNFNAADNRNKIDGLRRVALFDWLRYVNEGGITRLTSFQIEKLIGRFNEFDAAKIAALVANMITEGQRGIYFDRIKNQKNGTQKRKAESWENKW